MKPFVVLILVFLGSVGIMWLTSPSIQYALAGRIAMAAMLLLTSFGHFKFVEGMEKMLPDFLPFKRAIVYGTGVLEMMAAIGLLWAPAVELTGLMLILFFILILPSNILASMRHINLETGGSDGPGLEYLWFRIPLQLLFIGWTYWVALMSV